MFPRTANAMLIFNLVLVALCLKSSFASFVTFDRHRQSRSYPCLRPICSATNAKQDLEQTKLSSGKKMTTKGPRGTATKSKDSSPAVETGKKTKTKVTKGTTSATAKKSTATKTPQKATGRKTRKQKTKEAAEPAHWLVESDECRIDYDNSNSTQGVSLLHFKVRGNPRPLRRHRTNAGRIYNPSEKLQESFREAVRELLFSKLKLQPPIFEADEILVMTIIFRLKRPKKHFIGGKPGPDRMRESAPPQTSQTRTDVDNLVKFVFDSMNEILYQDDRQIMSLQVAKVLDNEGMCEGSTEILLRSIEDKDVQNLIEKSFEMTEKKNEAS